ncbi:MAG TPA: phenylalanine 4-monooxygenase [Caulobacteraceae bacterium]|nr:phenylalanine 4-monooxygenase [Caulobacteraceae bacterium]
MGATAASHAFEKPAFAADDWTVPQDWRAYTADEHAMWDRLFDRQADLLEGRAAQAFMDGLNVLQLSKQGIPDFEELSERLRPLTGWQVKAVPGLVPDDVFFRHLANRTFVAGRFIREPDQIDYLSEPDVFHDLFGHVPLLADPVFADYMQAYGAGGLRSLKFNALHHLARLYWYTVEFGLIRQRDGALKLYGAGILSSFGESRFALEDPSPNRVEFDLMRVMRTKYRIDDFQQTYFVIDSFADLLRKTVGTDFAPLYGALEHLPDIEPFELIDTDRVVTRGDQSHSYSGVQ